MSIEMKNTLKYISILVLGVLAAASCNLNNYPVFDDNDAFVAFDATGYEFNEPQAGQTDTVNVYVTLASVAGLSSTVAYEVVEDTTIALPAVQGYDYDLLDENGVLRFDENNRTCAIPIVLYSPTSGGADGYTGNKSFRLSFKSTGSVNAGSENTCLITIADIDHPLNAILGTYNMTGESYFSGPVAWPMTLSRDEADVNLVWFSGLVDTQTIGGFYGTVTMDEETGKIPVSITIQMGQQSTQTTSTCFLYGMDADGQYYSTSGEMPVEIDYTAGTRITFTKYGPSLCADPDAGSFYGIILAGCTGLKAE